MGDVMMLILGLIVGFLCEAWTSAKLIQDAVHTAYWDGYRDGAKEVVEVSENA